MATERPKDAAADAATQVPDTATTYERAKPEQESPQGKLTAEKPAGNQRPDAQSKQDASPNEKTA